MDDPVSMLNTYTGYNQGDRAYLQDLSFFEMGRNESDPNKSKNSSIGGETVPDKIESTINDIQMAKNKEDHIIDHYNDVFGAFPTESPENRNMNNEALSIGSGQIAGSQRSVVLEYYDCSVSKSLVGDPSGKEQNMATECAPMPLQAVKDINKIVKKVPAVQSYQVKVNFVALSQDGLSWAQFKLDFRSQ